MGPPSEANRTEEVHTQKKTSREHKNMIRIESIKPISNAGNLRAFATITIADKLRISDVRIIAQPNQKPWVSMPSRAYEKDGVRKWAPTIDLLDEKLKKEVTDAVLAEFVKLQPPQTMASAEW
jgi:DNA-binding cell septation regulator SpoVG